MAEVTPSICRICPSHCPILVTVENGKIAHVAGDPENALFEGYGEKLRVRDLTNTAVGMPTAARADDAINREVRTA